MRCSLRCRSEQRMQRLLVYLLLHRHHPRPHQQIAFALWPDTNEEQALKNLRTLLTCLRQSLPDLDRYLKTSIYALQWQQDAPCDLDVASFEDACALLNANGVQHGDILRLDAFGIAVLAFCDPDNIQVELTAPLG
jgi:DNA-binding SARP family transcriptional activator